MLVGIECQPSTFDSHKSGTNDHEFRKKGIYMYIIIIILVYGVCQKEFPACYHTRPQHIGEPIYRYTAYRVCRCVMFLFQIAIIK